MRPTKAERKAAQRRTLSRAETVVAPAVAKYLRKRGAVIANEAAAAYRKIQKYDSDRIDGILAELGVDLEGLTEAMRAELAEAYARGGETALVQVLEDPARHLFDALNPAASRYVDSRGAELVTDVEETTRAGLRGILESAFTDGATPAELAESIRNSYEFSEARAEMIARTEMAYAHIEGTLEGWRSSGVVNGKELILSNDHPQEDDCDEAAGMGVVDIDDDFGGLGDPPLHPYCECDVLPVVESADASDEE